MSDCPKRTWHNLDAAAYHAMPGFGSSAIRTFALHGPLEFYACHVAKTKQVKPTKSMRLGTAYHKAMEEPERWKDYIVRVPTTIEHNEFYDELVASWDAKSRATIPVTGEVISSRRKFDTLYVQKFQELAAIQGKEFLDDDQIRLVEDQVKATWDNPAIAEILSQPKESEVPVTLSLRNITLKALLDVLYGARSGFLDFKTTMATNPHSFWWEFKKRGYGFQFALYELVSGVTEHKVIYVHNQMPLEAQLMDVPRRLIENELEAVERHVEWLDQALGTIDLTAVDSLGIPLEFHNEMWGTEIDPVEMFLNPESSFGLVFDDEEEGVTA